MCLIRNSNVLCEGRLYSVQTLVIVRVTKFEIANSKFTFASKITVIYILFYEAEQVFRCNSFHLFQYSSSIFNFHHNATIQGSECYTKFLKVWVCVTSLTQLGTKFLTLLLLSCLVKILIALPERKNYTERETKKLICFYLVASSPDGCNSQG